MPGISNEQEGRHAAHFPANEGQQRIAGEQDELDAAEKETEDDEEAMETRLTVQVVGGKPRDQPADQCRHRRHAQRQAIEQEGKRTLPFRCAKPDRQHAMPRHHATAQRQQVDAQQQDQTAQRGQRRQPGRQRFAGIAAGAPEQHAGAIEQASHKGQRRHQPDGIGQTGQPAAHARPPSRMAGGKGADSPANQSAERATCGNTAGPAQASQPRRGQ